MSITAIAVVKARKTGSVTKKAVLLVLADYADEEWSCFPSQERIAWETDTSERTVRRALAELEEDGLVRRIPRRGATGQRTSDRIVLVESAIRHLPARLSGSQPANPATNRPIASEPTGHSDRVTKDKEPSEVEPSGEARTSPELSLVPPAPRTDPRGTRIPDDFAIDAEMLEWAINKFPGLNVREETEKFVDYWRSQAGAKARMANWSMGWKTWMRRSGEDIVRRAPRHDTKVSRNLAAIDSFLANAR